MLGFIVNMLTRLTCSVSDCFFLVYVLLTRLEVSIFPETFVLAISICFFFLRVASKAGSWSYCEDTNTANVSLSDSVCFCFVFNMQIKSLEDSLVTVTYVLAVLVCVFFYNL